MDNSHAIDVFAALSQETRLKAFRVLVEHGKSGIAAGRLSERLGIPQNTLSFHLSHLSHARLVTTRKQGRSVLYFANLDLVQVLIRFLLENCCTADKKSCESISKIMGKKVC